jgi:hypothetical protein
MRLNFLSIKVQAMHGLRGWFMKESPAQMTPENAEITAPGCARECLDKLETILSRIDPATREEMGDLLRHFARGLRPATKEAIIAVIDVSGKTEGQKAA